jgi:phenylacetate-coenzyme A ligase PaaK-like adenylate-forming protein
MGFAPPLSRRPPLPIIDATRLRIASLDASTSFANCRHFAPERWGDLENFSPGVLAGSPAQLQRLIDRMDLRTVNLASVDHSVFAITQLGDTPLPAELRDQLWRHFHVPIYEIYVDEHAKLLAFECEAQEGWHVYDGVRFVIEYGELLLERTGRVVRTGLHWTIEEAVCACNREGTRLIDPKSLRKDEPLFAAVA